MNKAGCIVICSSGHAFQTYPNYTAYAATKGGLLAFMRAAALDCAPYGIRVNRIIPGATDSPLLRYHLRNCPEDEPQILANSVARFATPEDIAKGVRFLAPAVLPTHRNLACSRWQSCSRLADHSTGCYAVTMQAELLRALCASGP